jgi:hypothetical protein
LDLLPCAASSASVRECILPYVFLLCYGSAYSYSVTLLFLKWEQNSTEATKKVPGTAVKVTRGGKITKKRAEVSAPESGTQVRYE